MSAPHIQRRYRTITDSVLLETMGAGLRTIREEDGATNADLGRVLGRSKATVERYLAGDRAMPFQTFVRGCQAWDGRFADGVLAFAGMRLAPIDAGESTDQRTLTHLCDLAARLAAALQDGIITDAERVAMHSAVRPVIAELGRLHRLCCAALPGPDTS